jgi:hypothetical protein
MQPQAMHFGAEIPKAVVRFIAKVSVSISIVLSIPDSAGANILTTYSPTLKHSICAGGEMLNRCKGKVFFLEYVLNQRLPGFNKLKHFTS